MRIIQPIMAIRTLFWLFYTCDPSKATLRTCNCWYLGLF